jgi:hypothetical protein
VVQLAEEFLDELRIPVLNNRFPRQPHQVQLIMYIVHGEQMRAGSLFRRNVVDVRAGYAKTALFCRTAAGACAPFFDWTKVFRVRGVAEVEYAP